MTRYSLNVINNSQEFFDICVFRKSLDIRVERFFSLAWLCQAFQPGCQWPFYWSPAYSFVWDETGKLEPGVIFEAAQLLPADPDNMAANAVTFDYSDGAYTFVRKEGPETGHLFIYESGSIPEDQAAVGIGMSGRGIFAVQARPGQNPVYTPDPSYWIAAGTFVQRQVLSIETLTNPAAIVFPTNVYAMTAILNPDLTWTITSTAQGRRGGHLGTIR